MIETAINPFEAAGLSVFFPPNAKQNKYLAQRKSTFARAPREFANSRIRACEATRGPGSRCSPSRSSRPSPRTRCELAEAPGRWFSMSCDRCGGQGVRNGMNPVNHPTGGFLQGNPRVGFLVPLQYLGQLYTEQGDSLIYRIVLSFSIVYLEAIFRASVHHPPKRPTSSKPRAKRAPSKEDMPMRTFPLKKRLLMVTFGNTVVVSQVSLNGICGGNTCC